MDSILLSGIMGAIILVAGAAWPEPSDARHPTKSIKNWLLAIGGVAILMYAILIYQQGGSIFFVLLESLVVMGSVLMMLNTSDKVDAPILTILSIGFMGWALYLYEDYRTIIFILGLLGMGLGYAFQAQTLRRGIALLLGSAIIAVFSYLEMSWIFFWLNVFFAVFSAYNLYILLQKTRRQE